MTDHDHLDDEAISAVLDGEGALEEVEHLDRCATCAARLAALRDASLLVRTPVPPPSDDERAAAIARALAGTTATVIPLRRRRPLPVWLGAAAAAIAVVAGIGLATRAGRDRYQGSDTAAGTFEQKSADAAGATTTAGATDLFDAGDIGDIDVRTLRSTVEDALSASARDSAAASGPSAPSLAAPAPEAAQTQRAVACEQAVRKDYPDLGALRYRAVGRLDGEDVEVLAFDGSARRWVYVVAASDCAIRNQTTYSA